MFDVSIVIISWNTKDYLKGCLGSIYQYPPHMAFETVVVDNQSQDGSPEMVAEEFPQVHLIRNSFNGGFAKGNNQAIHASNGKYILLLNPDTEVFPGAIDALYAFLEAHSEAGAVGSRLLNPDRTLQESCHPEPTLAREFWRLFHLDRVYLYGDYDMSRWPMDRPRAVEVIQGAAMMVRKQGLDEVGYLDDGYFMYTEEVDLCHRLRKAGWKLFYLPKSMVIHYGGKSTQQVAQKMFLRLYESRLRYFRKNYGEVQAFLYKVILILAATVRVLISPLAIFSTRNNQQRYQTLARYYRDLIQAIPRM